MTQSPHASPVMERRPIPTNLFTDPHLQQGLAKMKHEQELQHQLLIQHYRQQQQQLAQEHEKQIQDHIKVLLILMLWWIRLTCMREIQGLSLAHNRHTLLKLV